MITPTTKASDMTAREKMAKDLLASMIGNTCVLGHSERCGFDFVNTTQADVILWSIGMADSLIAALNASEPKPEAQDPTGKQSLRVAPFASAEGKPREFDAEGNVIVPKGYMLWNNPHPELLAATKVKEHADIWEKAQYLNPNVMHYIAPIHTREG